MPTIEIHVKNKIAKSPKERIVCGNSDYFIKFVFDDEWSEHDTKTARFIYNHKYEDVVFSGDTCPAPIISGATACAVGVFAGDLHTTTPALIECKKSILCDDGVPADPLPDVYAQLLEKYDEVRRGVQADWEQTDDTAADFIKNKPTISDSLLTLIETDMLPAVHNADGKIITDENGKIILRY